jgi:hypothetical protein
VRSYLTITKDLGRVMTRVKAIYRSWAIPCTGKQVYAARHRAKWLGKIGSTHLDVLCLSLLHHGLRPRQRREEYSRVLDRTGVLP